MICSKYDSIGANYICSICLKHDLLKGWILPINLYHCQCGDCFLREVIYCKECLAKLSKEVNEGVAQMVGD